MEVFSKMLADGMRERGHNVSVWTSGQTFSRLTKISSLKKWLGYIDQYIIFPVQVKRRIKKCCIDTLFVITDHSLGPWIPLVSKYKHVVHCHDFMAQLSAIGKIRENPLSWTGRLYQKFIRRGFRTGKNFISVSDKTRQDLHQFVPIGIQQSYVVYNGISKCFIPMPAGAARTLSGERLTIDITKGYLLHVGSDQWYKNREGLIEVYNEFRNISPEHLPLLLVGIEAGPKLREKIQSSPYKKDICVLSDLDIKHVQAAYCGASVFIFPSLDEGFGWPIAEAMACGCPVITTRRAPMDEVAGNAAYFIPRKPAGLQETRLWAKQSAQVICDVLNLHQQKRHDLIAAGMLNARRFNLDKALDKIESIYLNISSMG